MNATEKRIATIVGEWVDDQTQAGEPNQYEFATVFVTGTMIQGQLILPDETATATITVVWADDQQDAIKFISYEFDGFIDFLVNEDLYAEAPDATVHFFKEQGDAK